MKTNTSPFKKINQKITNRILEELRNGVIPWENPLKSSLKPQNLITGHHYRGVNLLLLTTSERPYFLTFNQASKIGAKVKKGSKSYPIVFWKVYRKKKKEESSETSKDDEETDDDKNELRFILKCFSVFKLDDIENIPEKYLKKNEESNNKKIPKLEEIISNFQSVPEIEYKVTTPKYIPSEDKIVLPRLKNFNSSNEYYSTYFHELCHSTGHPKRLNRLGKDQVSVNFNSPFRAKEECIAELGSSFLMTQANQSINIKNRSSYIDSWMKVLGKDENLLLKSASKAEKAVDFLQNKQEKLNA